MTSTKPHGHRPAKTSRIELRATEDEPDLLERPSPFATPEVDQPQASAAPRSRAPGWWRWPSRPKP